MGCFCFTACFGSSKKHSCKSKKPEDLTPPKVQNLSQSHELNEALLRTTNQTAKESQIAEIKGENEEQLDTSFRKKVTFDLLLKSTPDEEGTNGLVENEQKGNREGIKDKIGQDFLYSSEKKGEEKAKKEQSKDQADLLSDSTVSSLFTYPPNHKYQNCASSDDECVDMDFNHGNSEDDEVDGNKNDEVDGNHKDKAGCEDLALDQLESSESLFSISIETRKQKSAVEIGDEKEVSSPLKPLPDKEINKANARDRSQYVHSVLNPIENLSQWKAVRTKTTTPLKHKEKENLNLEQGFTTLPFIEKENFNLEQENVIVPFSEEPNLKQSQQQQRSKRFSNRLQDDEVAVDTSLSSWLVEYEKTPLNGNSADSVGNSSSKRTKSPERFEDWPILGVLAVEDLKQMSKSATPSPRRSPSHSPDEMPIIGTVGSYWRHTGETMDADTCSSGRGTSGASGKSRKCRKGGMNGHSTPFQAKLERAIDGATAQV